MKDMHGMKLQLQHTAQSDTCAPAQRSTAACWEARLTKVADASLARAAERVSMSGTALATQSHDPAAPRGDRMWRAPHSSDSRPRLRRAHWSCCDPKFSRQQLGIDADSERERVEAHAHDVHERQRPARASSATKAGFLKFNVS